MSDRVVAESLRGRVLFVNPALHAIGGMQAWLGTLMPDLERLGWEVFLGLPVGSFNDVDAYLQLHPWHRVLRFENPAGTEWGRVRGVEAKLEAARPDVIVVAHGVSALRAIERQRWRGRSGGTVLASIHSVEPGLFSDLVTYSHVVDGSVAPNRLVQALAESIAGLAPERSYYIPYGVDVDPELDLSTLGSRIELVHAGRLEDGQKRVSDLPRILRRLEASGVDWSLDLAGLGPDGAALEAALREVGGGARIRIHGALPPEVVRREILRPGRVLLLTSFWELGPVVAWEALGRAMPIVTSRFVGSGLEAGILDGVNGATFGVGDVESAAEAIIRLAPPEVRARLSEGSWRAAQARYDRKLVARQWESLLTAARRLRPRCEACPPRPMRRGPLPERLLGPALADRLRRLTQRHWQRSGPGDEWPHTEDFTTPREAFFERAAALDRGEAGFAATGA